jgi:endonuclease/exonuclease/phosphatase family metal-dependent hydrolase
VQPAVGMGSIARAALAACLLVACSGQDGTNIDGQSSSTGSSSAADHKASRDEHPSEPHGIGHVVKVMTRNLYLGADLAPAIGAPDLPTFVAATGAVLRQVTATNFPVRAKGLAKEICATKPDLVGLQEVALWRTGPPSIAPLMGGPKTAKHVRYDYLALLLHELDACDGRYRPVAIEKEFDFEAPADENGIPGDGPAPIVDAELNARLTMRDVILARGDGGVHVWAPRHGHFKTLLSLPVLGQPLEVTRGWVTVDARVRGTGPFHFVDTHLEAFDPASLHPSIRALQAGELVAAGGPATSSLPVILVGDLNSDDDTVSVDDQQAYRVLLAAGLVERSTGHPLSCCIESSYDLTTGSVSEFDHQVDHVMTDAPDRVKLVDSIVTGRRMHHGYWDSDHAGIFSALSLR